MESAKGQLAEMRQRIKSVAAQQAFDILVSDLSQAGLEIRPNRKGFLKAVSFWKGRFYPVSFIPNKGDLLFYIRNPALKLSPSLHGLALERHPGRVNVKLDGSAAENQARETKIRIADSREAKELLKWLVPQIRTLLANGA